MLEKANHDLGQQLKSANDQLEKMKVEKEDEKKHRDAVDKDLDEARKRLKSSLDENAALKAEVNKGVEDIAKALGDGYGRCLARISSTGFDVSGHSFEDYVRDFAATSDPETANKESVDP